jgi:hypothetical protein
MPELGGTYELTLDVPGADPGTSASVVVTAPSGATDTPAATASSDKTEWTADFGPIDEIGWYVHRWTVTGAGQGVKSGRFYVTPTVEGFGVWPPSVADMKLDMGDRDDQDDTSDDKLSMVLDAAISHVRQIKRSIYDVAAEEQSGVVLPPPPVKIILGTIRLAARLHSRRGSWDNLASTGGDLGSQIIPSYDSDIERLLETGRFTRAQDAFA